MKKSLQEVDWLATKSPYETFLVPMLLTESGGDSIRLL